MRSQPRALCSTRQMLWAASSSGATGAFRGTDPPGKASLEASVLSPQTHQAGGGEQAQLPLGTGGNTEMVQDAQMQLRAGK